MKQSAGVEQLTEVKEKEKNILPLSILMLALKAVGKLLSHAVY